MLNTQVTVPSITTDFSRTRAALVQYDKFVVRWNRELDRFIDNPAPLCRGRGFDIANRIALAYFRLMSAYRRKVVGEAFAYDTREYNNRNTILNSVFADTVTAQVPDFIRRLATPA